MEYQFKVTETDNFTVSISTDGSYGTFEHHTMGEDWGGGLWFDDNNELYDYDGVAYLPEEVQDELIKRGVDISYAYHDYNKEEECEN